MPNFSQRHKFLKPATKRYSLVLLWYNLVYQCHASIYIINFEYRCREDFNATLLIDNFTKVHAYFNISAWLFDDIVPYIKYQHFHAITWAPSLAKTARWSTEIRWPGGHSHRLWNFVIASSAALIRRMLWRRRFTASSALAGAHDYRARFAMLEYYHADEMLILATKRWIVMRARR
jgi:hypothetical protein